MKRFSRRWLLVGGLFLAAVIVALIWNRGGGGVERYKAGLRAKGEKLSFGELGFPLPPENPAAMIQLTNAVNKLASKNGFDPRSLVDFDYSTNGKALVNWLKPQPKAFASTKPTNSITWDDFRENLAGVSNQLSEIRAAVQLPFKHYLYDPETMGIGTRYPFVQMRHAAQWLAADSLGAMREQDRARAARDVEALAHLAQFNREDHTLVAQMIRVAIAGLGLQATWQSLQDTNWNEPDLAAMQRAWSDCDFFETFHLGLLGERASGEQLFTMVRTNGARRTLVTQLGGFSPTWSGTSVKDKARMTFISAAWRLHGDQDEMLAFEHYQGLMDCTRDIKTTPWPEIHNRSTNLTATLVATMDTAKGLSSHKYLFSSMLIPYHSKALSTIVRQETLRRLTITAIALERFRLRHGKFPDKLDELAPDFIAAVPVDQMNMKPLSYRLNADGSFTLYSVGENGKDDGGDTTPTDAKLPPDLWNSRDTAWPAADDSPPPASMSSSP